MNVLRFERFQCVIQTATRCSFHYLGLIQLYLAKSIIELRRVLDVLNLLIILLIEWIHWVITMIWFFLWVRRELLTWFWSRLTKVDILTWAWASSVPWSHTFERSIPKPFSSLKVYSSLTCHERALTSSKVLDLGIPVQISWHFLYFLSISISK